MKHECQHKNTIKYIYKDVSEMKSDVKSLLKFKWQVTGGKILVCAIISVVVAALSGGLFAN